MPTYTVPPEHRRARADKILAEAFPEHSRAALQRAFDAGLVSCAGKVLEKSDDLNGGDVVEFTLPEVRAAEVKAVDLPLNILFEDEHLIVLNKAPGMVVHPGIGTGEDTMVHALLAHCAGSLSGVGGVERPGIVHRLDKETSGVIVVAKTDAAHRVLSEQFAGRHLKKEYIALIAGVPDKSSGTIDRAISRHPTQRHRMTVGEGGRPSRTDWTLVEAFGKKAALVRCRIHTGRTHQIRVHMKSVGHSLLGDAVYGWKIDGKLPTPPRIMLHAERIAFLHPVTARPMDITAPMPDDFEQMIKTLRKMAAAS